jgi:hypothetical protein
MNYNPLAESKAHHICHVVGENEGIVLGDKSRHDIFSTVRDASNYWQSKYDEIKKENHEKRWNELRIWLRENPNASLKDIQQIMLHLDNGEYIRDIKVR